MLILQFELIVCVQWTLRGKQANSVEYNAIVNKLLRLCRAWGALLRSVELSQLCYDGNLWISNPPPLPQYLERKRDSSQVYIGTTHCITVIKQIPQSQNLLFVNQTVFCLVEDLTDLEFDNRLRLAHVHFGPLLSCCALLHCFIELKF